MSVLVIGIAGGSGSGKTTVTKKIKEEFADKVTVICHDSYYKSYDYMSFEDRIKQNFDHPDSLETELLVADLKELKMTRGVNIPIYCYKEFIREQETMYITPNRVIIVEGILIFENKALRDLMDIKIFVDTDADLRLIRKLNRDMNERRRTFEYVIKQYCELTKPMHEQFVEPSKKYADIIVPQGGSNTVALSMIFERIKREL